MKRFLLVGTLLFMFVLPVLGGHTSTGSWCQCGCPGCLCLEGEEPELCISSTGPVSDAKVVRERKGVRTSDAYGLGFRVVLLQMRIGL